MDSIVDAVRPIIQPITHNLPGPITQAGEALIGQQCYQLLVLDFQPLKTPECVKLAVSKVLGIGIIGASSIVKLPQLISLIRTKSAAGLSFLSYLLETTSYVITFAYNARQGFPFSTYGESALIAFQNVLIGAALLHYSKQTAGSAAWIAGVAVAVPALLDSRVVPENAMSMLQAGAGLLGVASKVPQIWTIFREGSTGVLSAFAVFNYLVGSLSRIFTTLQEVDDPLILYGFIAGFTLNLILAGQMLYYWNTPASKSTKKAKKAAIKGQATPVAASSARAKTPTTRRRG